MYHVYVCQQFANVMRSSCFIQHLHSGQSRSSSLAKFSPAVTELKDEYRKHPVRLTVVLRTI